MINTVAFLPNSPTLIGDLGVKHEMTVSALMHLGEEIRDSIDAVVIMTPHFQTSGSFGVVSDQKLKQIFDFYGFPQEFYNVEYEASGEPELSQQIINIGTANGIRIASVINWGLDHGAWSPLVHVFKDADVPIVPISICPELGPEAHVMMGRLIRSTSIRKRLCVLSTGSLIHRLDLFQHGSSETPPKAMEYLDLCITAFDNGNWDMIWNARPDIVKAAAPEGYNLPLRFIQGVIGEKFNSRILSNEIEFNAASLTTVVFESL
jgi:4,5-DOPA dioxygenase extradiol